VQTAGAGYMTAVLKTAASMVGRENAAVDASSFSLALAELASVLRKEIQQTSQAGLATA